MKYLARIAPLALFAPLFAMAQSVSVTWLETTITTISTFISGTLVPFVFALAFIVFIWGMFKTFVLGGSDPDKQAEGKQLMIYAIIGLAVMIGIWGLVNIVTGIFGFTGAETITIPTTPTTGGTGGTGGTTGG